MFKIILLAGLFNLVFLLSFMLFSKTAYAVVKHGGTPTNGVAVVLLSWSSPENSATYTVGGTLDFSSSYIINRSGDLSGTIHYFITKLHADGSLFGPTILYSHPITTSSGINTYSFEAEVSIPSSNLPPGTPPGPVFACVGFSWEDGPLEYWCESIWIEDSGGGGGDPPPPPPNRPDLVGLPDNPGVLQVGDTVTFTGSVDNIGTVNVGKATIAWFWLDPPGRFLKRRPYPPGNPQINIPPLARGGSESVVANSSWTAPNIGLYKLELCADVGKLVWESNEGNNCGSVNLVVRPPQPNLEAQNLDTITSGPYEDGDDLYFSGDIANTGNLGAGESDARFCIDSTAEDDCFNTTDERISDDDEDIDVAAIAVDGSEYVTSDAWPATEGDHTIYLCADVGEEVDESDENDNCMKKDFTVGPDLPDPWLLTTGGDVGSIGLIDPIVRDLLNPDANAVGDDTFNADYLIIGDGVINPFFRSHRGWSVDSYPGGIALHPDPGGSMYDTLRKLYGGRCADGDPEILKPFTPGGLEAAVDRAIANSGCNVMEYEGNAVTPGSWRSAGGGVGYDGKPVVVFITGGLAVTNDIRIDGPTGIIFVVKGDIIIWPRSEGGTGRMDGIYITDGVFNTNERVSCGGTSWSEQLVINGAVYAFGQACFTRKLYGDDNLDTPAERINFEPKYLWLFQEPIGDSKVIYREVVP